MKRLRGKLTLTCAHRYVGDVCWSQGAVLSAESRDVSDSTGMFVRNVESKDAIAASKGQAAPVPPKRVVGLHYVLRFCVLKLPNQNLCFEIVLRKKKTISKVVFYRDLGYAFLHSSEVGRTLVKLCFIKIRRLQMNQIEKFIHCTMCVSGCIRLK